MRFPMGFSPGHMRLATISLTIATGALLHVISGAREGADPEG